MYTQSKEYWEILESKAAYLHRWNDTKIIGSWKYVASGQRHDIQYSSTDY
jgi:hypothetical protein